MRIAIALVAFVACFGRARATTWDEPWHEDVVRDAQTLVLAEIVESSRESFRAVVRKHVVGAETPTEILVNGYSLLRFVEAPDEDEASRKPLTLKFFVGGQYYLFLSQAEGMPSGEYRIATPTAGWSRVYENGISATYRISMHQVLVTAEVYEATQAAIFRKLHGASTVDDERFMRSFFEEWLRKPPRNLDEDLEVFSHQHVALESFAHFGTAAELSLLEPFLRYWPFHVQASAVRGLCGVEAPQTCEWLLSFVRAKRHGFAKWIALRGLSSHGCEELLPRLRHVHGRIASRPIVVNDGFEKDPRRGIGAPATTGEAMAKLIEEWSEEAQPPVDEPR